MLGYIYINVVNCIKDFFYSDKYMRDIQSIAKIVYRICCTYMYILE